MQKYTTYLNDKQIAARFGVNRCTVWRWVKKNEFPSPIRLSDGCTRWRDGDVDRWEEKRA